MQGIIVGRLWKVLLAFLCLFRCYYIIIILMTRGVPLTTLSTMVALPGRTCKISLTTVSSTTPETVPPLSSCLIDSAQTSLSVWRGPLRWSVIATVIVFSQPGLVQAIYLIYCYSVLPRVDKEGVVCSKTTETHRSFMFNLLSKVFTVSICVIRYTLPPLCLYTELYIQWYT